VNSSGKVIGMDTAASAGSLSSRVVLYDPGLLHTDRHRAEIAGEIISGDSSSTVHVGPTSFLGVNVISPGSGGYGFGGGGFGSAPVSSGAEIASVVSGSPASQAGLAQGDTITSLGASP